MNNKPVLGINPGSRWTSAVVRLGDLPVTGWTIGPTTPEGYPDRTALNDPDDVEAQARYVARVLELVDATFDAAAGQWGTCRVAVKSIDVPVSVRHGRRSPVQVVDWLIPRLVVLAVLSAYEGVIIPASSVLRSETYPAALVGTRASEWGPNEAPQGERDHERLAYDVAGLGALVGAR